MTSSVIKNLDTFFSQFPEHEYKKGDMLIQAQVEPSGVFYIKSGIIKSYWISKQGTEITLNMFKPHAFIPMSWALGISNSHFYEAMTPVRAIKAPKDRVLSFLREEPDILFDLLRRIYVGIEGLWTHIELLSIGTSHLKLIATLLILIKRFGQEEKNETVVQLKLNESEIANYAGMSRETASRELQKLKKENLISINKGNLIIHNVSALEEKFSQ